MSAPHRPPSLDRSDHDRLSQPDRHPVSPISSRGEHEFAHSHPSAFTPISPVEPVPGQQDSWVPRQGPSPWNRTHSTATPEMDNLGPAAVGGGISGIALGIANSHDRQSGIDARQSLYGGGDDGFIGPVERGYHTTGSDNPYIPAPREFQGYASSDSLTARYSYGSNAGLNGGAGSAGHAPSGSSTPRIDQLDPSRRSLLDRQAYPYPIGPNQNDGPYQRNSAYIAPDAIAINPDEIADDGEDPIPISNKRRSHPASRASVVGAAAGAGLGAFGGIMRGSEADNPSYGPVPGGGGGLEAGEKNRWVQPKPSGRSRRRGWVCGAILAFIIIGAIIGGAVGGTLGNRESNKDASRGDTSTAKADEQSNGDLDKDSSEIKDLMDNKNLHKVFPGVDYTPWGVQYPLCLTYPPSQNNVTRDMAVLSQMTNTVRLYGTDCNQTEMVLHAIDRLGLKDMKLWLGVWIENNDTTNDRQLRQLYNIIEDADDISIFKGAIIGNEALFRAGPNINEARTKLIGYMKDVREEFKKKNIDLPIATSDLGDNWDQQLADVSDFVMSNIHPFFAGVTVDKAASWAYEFWQSHDVPLTNTNRKQIISEIGWPSGGGNDCGSDAPCPNSKAGSVSGVDEMNQFMSEWVCQALDNGTEYFWFEAFDEPWKVIYNEPGRAWEDKWGLMDAARKLKPGLKIPDCDGKTAS